MDLSHGLLIRSRTASLRPARISGLSVGGRHAVAANPHISAIMSTYKLTNFTPWLLSSPLMSIPLSQSHLLPPLRVSDSAFLCATSSPFFSLFFLASFSSSSSSSSSSSLPRSFCRQALQSCLTCGQRAGGEASSSKPSSPFKNHRQRRLSLPRLFSFFLFSSVLFLPCFLLSLSFSFFFLRPVCAHQKSPDEGGSDW